MRWLFFIFGYCLLLKYLLPVCLPFVIAILVYFFIKPFIHYLENIFHIKKSAIGMSLLVIIYLIIVLLFASALTYLCIFGLRLLHYFVYYVQNDLSSFISHIIAYFTYHFSFIDVQQLLYIIKEVTQNLFIYIFESVKLTIQHFPSFFFSIFLFVICTFFLVLEYDEMRKIVWKYIPIRLVYILPTIKKNVLQSLKIYFYCQMITTILCWVLLAMTFCILRLKHFIFYSLLISLLDSLPFIGVGIVLLPMCCWYCIKRMYIRALYIFIMYLLLNMFHELVETRIMKKQFKIPSFFLLLSLIIHIHFLGIIGIILSPIHMNILYTILNYKKVTG